MTKLLTAALVLAASVAHADYQSQMKADSPWAFYRFNDGSVSTSMTDTSGNGRTGGWIGGGSHPTSTTGLLYGDSNAGMDFDGTNDYGSIGSGFLATNGSFTIETWAKFDDVSGNPALLGQSGACGADCFFWLDLAGTGMRATVWSTSGGVVNLQCAPAGGLSTGTTYHFAVVYTSATSIRCVASNSTTFLLKDTTSTSITGTQQTGGGVLTVGTQETCSPGVACPSDLVNGIMDEFSFKQAIITDSHLRAHWQWGFGYQPRRRR
jgi:hypothetical protein